MARVCQPAMCAVNEDLKFTVETGDDYPDKHLPTLDFKFGQTKEGYLVHTYFQKPMKTPFVIMAKSAMGDHQRYSILTNELIRRLSTIDTDYVKHEQIQENIRSLYTGNEKFWL